MKITIKKSLQGLLLVPALALGVSAVAPVVQQDVAYAQFEGGPGAGADAAQGDNPTGDVSVDGVFKLAVNVLLYVVGAVAVIMIIVGGFKYVTSGGDSSGVTSAKNTILYAVIGLIVAVLAFALVNFVLDDIIGGIGTA